MIGLSHEVLARRKEPPSGLLNKKLVPFLTVQIQHRTDLCNLYVQLHILFRILHQSVIVPRIAQ